MAVRYRKIARSGGDPLAEKRKAQIVVPTFREAARTVHAEHRAAWRNEKHAAQWLQSLTQHAFPHIGDCRVDLIDTPDVLKVLSPIWLTKPETARRIKQRIGTVLDWAKACRFREGENPIDGVSKALPKQPDRKNHFAALPYPDVPQFIATLRASEAGEPARLAFEYLILTAARTSEVLNAAWNEIDFDSSTWTIPASRMKANQEHRVPLPPRCIEILRRAREISSKGDLVFPGRSLNKPMSNMVFLMALRRMGPPITVHGFRSAFRDWAAERTNFSREVCELALAHSIGNKVEAAYRRGDLFEKRRELMATWAAFATNAPAEVISIRTA